MMTDHQTIDGLRSGRLGRRLVFGMLVAVLLCGGHPTTLGAATPAPEYDWKVGAASAVITPSEPMWLAGYAARNKPSEGKIHDLRAKALAIEDPQGTHLVIVTLDLLGISRAVRDRLETEVTRGYGLPPEGLLINVSHTHCGPVMRETRYSVYGNTLYGLSPEDVKRCQRYADGLQETLVQLVGQAFKDMTPATLSYSHARAGFAMNRRARVEDDYQIQPNPDGPVDHDVPVLRVDGPDGELRAVLFGYACHGTTLNFYKFCGDYAGFAQEVLESSHPGAVALFVAGCGGDQNPYPRRGPRSLEYCGEHGRALANAVEAALTARARPLAGPIRAAIEEVTLDFAAPPDRQTLEQQIESKNTYERRHAQALLDELEETGRIASTYPYLVQVIDFGDDLTFVGLSGEVVVDYSLRLKAELTGRPLWVAGYCNDVFGYLPSRRVLQEGGYEGGGAMVYTPLPGPFAPSVEQRVIGKVHELIDKVRVSEGQ
ncbi:MAG: neutral/alkaline non-lysosomal ceramidase N-terminal domain-containing protein [Sedimentisphaerales bacterium]|nr:neutral/alkaline non-lysosomal ceramidase N-terminal domain-containing protein [Sedimentisphaerales bacterium]